MSGYGIVKISPGIQHYAWGGTSYIPEWLGIDNSEHKPFAEAWYGDHPLAPARVIDQDTVSLLNHWIEKDPVGVLGQESIDIYGAKMPFLLKILDVKEMLSLQLHPGKDAAALGYDHENELGIPLTAPNRNYKDKNHKPEILFALSDFWMLQGFAPMDEIRERFRSMIPNYKVPDQASWRSVMQSIWALNGKSYLSFTRLLGNNLSNKNLTDKNQIFHWVAKAFSAYPPDINSVDRGLMIMLLLNVQYLRPGQVGYQAPGVLHAYLEGQNIELMANSDNVLRGGLTPKYIDPTELMKHLDTDTSGQYLVPPLYLMDDEVAFATPVKDFILKHFIAKKGNVKSIQFNTVVVILVKKGQINYENEILYSGESIFIPAFKCINLKCLVEETEYFLATSSL